MGSLSPSGANDSSPKSSKRGLYSVNPFRKLFFGSPLATEHQEHTRLPKILALPVFASDAISSVAYATQQILLALGAAGLWTLSNRVTYTNLTLGVTFGIVFLLIVVVFSYWQTIFAYPSGGGSYIVSKDNLGVKAGLVAAAALLIDYVLTVSVSIASGVQNLLATPIMARFANDLVPICLLFIALLVFANLRGLKESGTLFAIPTYLFVVMGILMIVLGLAGPSLMGWHLYSETVNQTMVETARGNAEKLTSLALLALVLKAFANGCSAMTGVEAVSNGIPAFRRPESRNAALTLMAMGAILGFLFIGISWLATNLHVVYWEHGKDTAMPVIDQISGAVFGKTGNPVRVALYYIMQMSTTAILVLAANTSFADFPRLSSILARDGFMPRQLSNLGDKLTFTNGIVLLGLFAMILILAFHGSVDQLIPLYAVGVFTAFSLSQGGMVLHWRKERGKGWHAKAIINGIGAVCTAVVLLDIIWEKFRDGAWMVIILAGILYVMFRAIERHYIHLRNALSMEGYVPKEKPSPNTVLILVPRLHRGIMKALDYGRSLSADVRAVHIETDPAITPQTKAEWEQWVADIPLVILPSRYRSIIGPLLAYLDEVDRERPDARITVIVPEAVTGKWWHSLLHANYGAWIKFYLLNRRNVIVANVRYFVDDLERKRRGKASASSELLPDNEPAAQPPAPVEVK